MNRVLLEQPFSDSQIKQRQGHGGMLLDYIEGHAVIQRLNDAFDGVWSFAITERIACENEVIVLGELRVSDIVKAQYGSSKISRSRQTDEPISLGDDYKSAATDALKKAATLFGVGLHLYRKDEVAVVTKPANQAELIAEPAAVSGADPAAEPKKRSPRTPTAAKPITERQIEFIRSIAKTRGMGATQLDAYCFATYNTILTKLDRQAASSLIDYLQHKKGA